MKSGFPLPIFPPISGSQEATNFNFLSSFKNIYLVLVIYRFPLLLLDCSISGTVCGLPIKEDETSALENTPCLLSPLFALTLLKTNVDVWLTCNFHYVYNIMIWNLYIYSKLITTGTLVNICHHTQLQFFPCNENFWDLLS